MFYWRESFGNIYPMLKKLLLDGLVEKKDAPVKKKRRLVYQLNERGWEELHIWLQEPASLNRYRFELLMKLRFGTSTGVENMISQLSHYRKLSLEQLYEAESLLEYISNSGNSLTDDLRKITLTLFTERKKATLSWCDDSIKTLKKWEGSQTPTAGSSSNLPPWNIPDNLPHDPTAVVSVPPRIIPLME